MKPTPTARRARHACAALLLLLALGGLAHTGSAHAYLAASTPPPGGTLEPDSAVLALRFSERIDAGPTQAALVRTLSASLDADASQDVGVILDVPSTRPQELRIEAPPLGHGAYTLSWRAVATDGHVVTGALPFTVATSAAGDGSGVLVQHAPTLALEGIGRVLFFVGVAVVVGLPVFASEVAGEKRLDRRIRIAMLLGSVTAAAGTFTGAAALAQSVGVRPLGLLGLTAGRFLLVQGSLLLVAMAWTAVAVDKRPQVAPWAAVPAFLAMSVHAMGGHGLAAFDGSEGTAGHVVLTLHLAGAVLWAGGLAALLLLLPGLERGAATELMRRFFALAVVSTAVVAVTGLYEAYVHIPAGAALDGVYVRLLVAKSLLLAGLVVFGAWHAFVWPRRAERTGSVPRTLRMEAAVMATVLLAAGALATVPTPVGPLAPEGPRVAHEDEVRLGDHVVRISLAGDPLRPGPVPVTLVLLPETSARPDAADVAIRIENVSAHLEGPVEGPLAGSAQWHGVLRFSGAGPEQVVVDVDGHRHAMHVIVHA